MKHEPSSEGQGPGRPSKAEEAYQEFLRRRKSGEELSFESFCEEQKDLAPGLRIVHSLHRRNGGEEGRTEDDPPDVLVPDSLLSTQDVEVHASQPEMIGPYRLLEKLGEGGFGVVHLAQQETPLRRKVALKVIKEGMDTRQVVARFEAERQALALMNHPHVAKVLDAGTTPTGRPYFVMEHVPGAPINTYCDRHRLDTRERLEVFLQVCDAVQHAHQKGLIHRDLKPSNILVTDLEGRRIPKVIDFGIAKAVHQRLTDKTLHTEQGVFIGTPEYMSPEQAEFTSEDIDTRADIYSLGVILYELLVGALPLDFGKLRRAGLSEIQRTIREVDPPRPSTRLSTLEEVGEVARNRRTDPRSLVRKVRGDLDWIVMQAQEKDRGRRYQSASELAADIARHLNHEPVLARPPSVSYRLGKFLRKHRARVVASAAALVLVVGFSLATWQASQARARQENLRLSREHRQAGLGRWTDFLRLRDQSQTLKGQWQKFVWAHELSDPVWQRQDELAAWREYSTVLRQVEPSFGDAVIALNKALEFSRADPEELRLTRKAIEEMHWNRLQEAWKKGGIQVSADYFQRMVEVQEIGTYAQQLAGSVTLDLVSEPPEAEVHCFRYTKIEEEERLLPLPFSPGAGLRDARAGLRGKPALEVERVWDATVSPFAVGDRFLAVRGREVSTCGDFARALQGLSTSEAVEVKVLRQGGEVLLSWVPFSKEGRPGQPSFGPGKVVNIPLQFRFQFAGYPLDTGKGSLLGLTRPGAPLSVELPAGSYLLVFRKAGYAEARVPVAPPGSPLPEKLHLVREDEVPPGFVYIPTGPVAYGGDPQAFQSLPHGEARLPGFFLGRYEVTIGEYLRFINDPEVFPGIDANGEADPSDESVARDLQNLRTTSKVRLIPWDGYRGKPFIFERSDQAWKAPKDSDDWPVFGLQQLAAREYAHWRTRKDARGIRYRLPNDLEWEKAARGVDRRTYVWGDYMVWSFALCYTGSPRQSVRLQPVGSSPLDESPYGVRDLSGSVEEHTSDRPVEQFNYTSLRGGSWRNTDEYYFRVATRNGRRPTGIDQGTGFRLAADLERAKKASAPGEPR